MRHEITALKDVTVAAHVFVQSSRPLPPGRQGQSQGRMPFTDSVEKQFRLKKGESRDDIHFLVSVTAGDGYSAPRQILLPEKVGESTQDGDLLRIEAVASSE